MNAKVIVTNAYIFDDFRFDARNGLLRDGVKVPIPPKEQKLLGCLLAAEGRVVSRNYIEDTVWPQEAVGYMSLARCISSLRRLLGGGRDRYIQTVPKRGYRFVAEAVAVPVCESRLTFCFDQLEPRSQSYYLEGLRQGRRLSADSLERALDCFGVVAERSPDAAFVYEQMAFCRVNQMLRSYVPPADARRAGESDCEMALQLTPGSPTACALRAWFRGTVAGQALPELTACKDLFDGDQSSAVTEFVHMWLLRAAGDLDASVEIGRQALLDDPFSSMILTSYSWSLFCAGRIAEALELTAGEIDNAPWNAVLHAFHAVYAAYAGKLAEAASAARTAVSLRPNIPALSAPLSYVLACSGSADEARRIADALVEMNEYPRVPRAQIAPTYVKLGDLDRARALIDTARAETCPSFQPARFDPRLAALFGEAAGESWHPTRPVGRHDRSNGRGVLIAKRF